METEPSNGSAMPQRPPPRTVIEWLNSELVGVNGEKTTVLRRMTELFARNGHSFAPRLYKEVVNAPKEPYGCIGLAPGESFELQHVYGTLLGFYMAEGFASEAEVKRLAQEEIERARKGIYVSPAKRLVIP